MKRSCLQESLYDFESVSSITSHILISKEASFMLRPTSTDSHGTGYYMDDSTGEYYYGNPQNGYMERSQYDHPERDNPQDYGGYDPQDYGGYAPQDSGPYSSEMKKDPGNVSNALSKGVRNAFCVLGIIAVIVLMCIVAFFTAALTADEPEKVSKVGLSIFSVCCYYSIFGLIRVMLNKTFFIRFKKRDDVKPINILIYLVIVLGSVAAFWRPIYNSMEDKVIKYSEDLKLMGFHLFGHFYEVIPSVFTKSIGFAALAGIGICLIVKLLFGSRKPV